MQVWMPLYCSFSVAINITYFQGVQKLAMFEYKPLPQAIQNQSEMESLRKKLNSCIGEKDKLERYEWFSFSLNHNHEAH